MLQNLNSGLVGWIEILITRGQRSSAAKVSTYYFAGCRIRCHTVLILAGIPKISIYRCYLFFENHMPVARKFPVYMTNNVSSDSYIKVTPNIIKLVLNQLKQQLFYIGRPQLM